MPEEAQVEGTETGTVRVAAVAMHSVMGDPRANLERIEQWAQQARDQGATFALFPEECITGSLNKSDLDPSGELVAEHLATEGMVVVEVSREKIRAAQESGCCTAAEARAEVYATPTVIR